MGKIRIIKKALSGSMAVMLIGSGITAGLPAVSVLAADDGSQTAIEAFLNPDVSAKPMARMWFPDAYAGIDEDDTIEKQIQSLAEAGFGGVEIAMMVDGGSFDNEDAKTIGWGTEAYSKLLKKVLTAANAIEGGFIVDITYTAHWPLTINSIDPNDDAQQQSLVSSWQKVTAEDLANGIVELNQPEIRYYDQMGAPFVFKNTLVSSSLVKVESVNEDGSLVLDTSSMKALETTTLDKTTKAGVPDAETLAATDTYVNDGVTEDTVKEYFGDAGDPENIASDNGKIDADGNRVRMADTQNYYSVDVSEYAAKEEEADGAGGPGGPGGMPGGAAEESVTITPSEGSDVQAGDYILLNVYSRGTGQIQSDGSFGGTSIPMYGRSYVPTYFQMNGADAVTNYWEDKILDDELTALLQENGKLGSSIFEDSLELTKEGAFWANTISDKAVEIKGEGYAYTDEIPAIMAATTNDTISFNDTELADQIEKDYNSVLGDLYEENHSKPLSDWAKETLGYTFRAQTMSMTGLDIAEAAAKVDVPEGDNGSKGDGLRNLSAAVNLGDRELLSMEAVTGMGNNALNWEDVLTEVSQNYSDGVNRVILHGTPYSKSANGYNSSWPGWMAFGNCFSDSYSYRQAYWDEAEGLTTFMAKTQAVLQNSRQKIDLAIMQDKENAFTLASGNSFQKLLDNGYSYNLVNESLLTLDGVAVTDGVLDAEGAAYKALVLDGVSTISSKGLETVYAYAKAGLPVYIYNCDFSNIYGTDCDSDSRAALEAAVKNLEKLGNVTFAATEDTLLSYLKADGIISDSSYEAAGLEATHYLDETDGNDYYYLFNNTKPENSGMINSGDGNAFKTGSLSAEVTLKGEGTPYLLNAMDGSVTPVAAYTDNGDGTLTMRVELSGAESVIVAIAEDTTSFPEAPAVHAQAAQEGTSVEYEDGTLVLEADAAGTYTVALSDGTEKEVEITADEQQVDLGTDGWNVTVVSYGPNEEANAQGGENYEGTTQEWSSAVYEEYLLKDPSDTKRTEITVENGTLGAIADLAVTDEQLSELGVESMQQVSGTVTYTKTFTLPEGWDANTAVEAAFTYNRDEVVKVEVNGTDIGNISNITDKADISDYLTAGDNTIAVTIATTLLNRTLYTNPWAAPDGESPNYTIYGKTVEETQEVGFAKSGLQLGHTSYDTNGLNSVILTAHSQAGLGE